MQLLLYLLAFVNLSSPSSIDVSNKFGSTEMLVELAEVEKDIAASLTRLLRRTNQAANSLLRHINDSEPNMKTAEKKQCNSLETDSLAKLELNSESEYISYSQAIMYQIEQIEYKQTKAIKERIHQIDTGNANHFVHHPVDSFLLMRRRSSEYALVSALLRNFSKYIIGSTEMLVELTEVKKDIAATLTRLLRRTNQAASSLLRHIIDSQPTKKTTEKKPSRLVETDFLTELEQSTTENKDISYWQAIQDRMQQVEAREQEDIQERIDQVDHPDDSFVLMKRESDEYDSLSSQLRNLSKYITDTLDEIDRDELVLIPIEGDVSMAAKSLMKLQSMYSLTAEQLASGKLSHLTDRKYDQTPGPKFKDLDAEKFGNDSKVGDRKDHDVVFGNSLGKLGLAESLYLARTAETMDNNQQTQDWLIYSAQLFLGGEELPPDMIHMESLLVNVTKEQATSIDVNKSNMLNESLTEEEVRRREEEEVEPEEDKEPVFGRVMVPKESRRYHKKLCTTYSDIRSPGVLSALRCHFTSRDSPYLLLMPLKVEVMSQSPLVLLYHNFLSHLETRFFINNSRDELQPAKVGSKDQRKMHMHRTSTTASLGRNNFGHENADPVAQMQDEIPFLGLLNRRIEAATQLNVNSIMASEAYQVANYGIGGEYEIHHDFFKNDEDHPTLGNRLTTFLMYLTDVEAGGATVFPYLGISVRPQKGMALLWYNLRPNGTPDLLTLHSACPVLIGNKWIVTKWALYNEQFRKFPCPQFRHQKSKIEFPL